MQLRGSRKKREVLLSKKEINIWSIKMAKLKLSPKKYTKLWNHSVKFSYILGGQRNKVDYTPPRLEAALTFDLNLLILIFPKNFKLHPLL